MKISRRFKIGKTQYELDFVDIDARRDLPLFVDPYFLALRDDAWSVDASRTIRGFFEHFLRLIRSGKSQQARGLFENLHEPNETCLGLSKGRPSGRGVGSGDADKIFGSLLKSRAVLTGIVEDIEDCRVFVDGIDKDKISDMTTNVIRGHLIRYTQDQCKLCGIPLQAGVPSGPLWDRKKRAWVRFYTEMLVVANRKVLLVPKGVVSYADKYTAHKYHQHFVLNYLQNEHLRLNTALVQRRRHKDGSLGPRFVTKKSILEREAPASKEFLVRFTESHPEVFRDFRKQTAKHVFSLRNEDLGSADVGLREVVARLIRALQSLRPGDKAATKYHRTVAGILELIFYPNLIAPQIEREIHNGRKRIDITFDNAASEGFFRRLHTSCGIPAQFIHVECKNYSRDVANPELDQLAGRFSLHRGKFGLIVCREIDEMSNFLARCSDTFHDDRGVILPLVDGDLISLLGAIADGDQHPEEALLSDRYRAVALS